MQKNLWWTKCQKKVLKNRIQPFMYISQPHLIHPNPSFIGLFPERASEELKKKSTYALNICQAQKKWCCLIPVQWGKSRLLSLSFILPPFLLSSAPIPAGVRNCNWKVEEMVEGYVWRVLIIPSWVCTWCLSMFTCPFII